MTFNGTHDNAQNRNYKRRSYDNSVRVPNWVFPFFLSGFVIAASLWVKDIAAEDTNKKLRPVINEIEEMDDAVRKNDTRIILMETKLLSIDNDIKEAKAQTQQNTRLLIRIADKMNVDTDDMQ